MESKMVDQKGIMKLLKGMRWLEAWLMIRGELSG